MDTDGTPIHETGYRFENGKCRPMLSVVLKDDGHSISLGALADTGCDVGILLVKEEFEFLRKHYPDFDFGSKVNDDPLPVGLANGRDVGADVYPVRLELSGQEKIIEIWVVDPDRTIRTNIETIEKIEDVSPSLGRGFLGYFDVMFKGKAKKVQVFK